MSCRRRAPTASDAPSSTAADIDDREMSKAAQERANRKTAQERSGKTAAAAQTPVPWMFFAVIFAVLLRGLYLTVKYS